MRLLVTGASGYVGAGILKRAPKDWQIAATFLAHRIEQPGVAVFRLDVRDADAVKRLFNDFRPDVVIHTAAQMTGDQMMATNADGSRNVARAVTQSFDSAPSTRFAAQGAPLRTQLIHLSSDVIFDGEHAPYDESAPPSPITPYAESKARAEQWVRAECADAIIVRTSLVYGFDPMDARTRQTLNGEFPRLFTDEYRCPIFVDDLADALIEIARKTSGISEISEVSIINLAGPQRLSRYEFGIKFAKAFQVDPRFSPALVASSPTPRPRDCALDISLAQKNLSTPLRSVDEVLANTIRNF